MRQIPRFAGNDKIFGAGKTDPFGQRTRGFRTAGSQRELPEHVDVETLRAKTALRMTRTGCSGKGPITQEHSPTSIRAASSGRNYPQSRLIRFAFLTAPIYN